MSQLNTNSPEKRKYPNLHILLVEDYDANILVATTILEYMGCSYDVAKTGVEALEKIKQNNFNIILMDVQMPEMDGLKATQHLRQWESETGKKPLPVIGMTAHVLHGDKERCLQAGMDYYIAKPFQQRDLEEKFDIIMNLSYSD